MSLRNPASLCVSIVVGLLLSVIMGCSTVFILPEEDGEMEKIYLLRYTTWGHHSLAFYRNSTLVEFTYGDWDLFALNKRDAWTAWKNMTFLSQGALGRKVVPWEPGFPICPLFKDCLQVKEFQAPVKKVRSLHDRLQTAFAMRELAKVLNEHEQVYFVKYDVPYWGFHNCNHEVADWLEQLGGHVSGRVFLNPDFVGGALEKN